MKIHDYIPSLQYIRKLHAQQDELLTKINDKLYSIDRSIQIGAEEGRLLQLLIALREVKTIVEVGTLGGTSTLWMARALPQDGHIYTCEKDPEMATLAQEFFDQSEVKNRITLLQGNALDSLGTIESKGPFDMIFIDADKTGYPHYLDWAETHIRKGGIIVADNTLHFSTTNIFEDQDTPSKNYKAVREFNERLADTTQYNGTIIPTKEGLSVAIKLF